MRNLLFALPVLGVILSCSGTKQVACESDLDQWYAKGKALAESGVHVRKFEQYNNKCAGSIGEEQKDAYLDGYTTGILEFCTYESGYKLGRKKVDKREVCPYELRAEFVRGYKYGLAEINEKIEKMEHYNEEHERYLEQTSELNRESMMETQ